MSLYSKQSTIHNRLYSLATFYNTDFLMFSLVKAFMKYLIKKIIVYDFFIILIEGCFFNIFYMTLSLARPPIVIVKEAPIRICSCFNAPKISFLATKNITSLKMLTC